MDKARRQQATGWRMQILVGAALALASLTASAQTLPLLQQPLTGSLGAFSAAGKVSALATGVVMHGATLGTDGAITSPVINTRGMGQLTVAYDRVTANMLGTDMGQVDYAVNGGAFTRLEATRLTSLGRATFRLPSTANNSTLVLRFKAAAGLPSGTFTVANVTVSGTPWPVAGATGRAPALGPFVTFESGHVRPMALSADSTKLYVVNTPDARVEVFDVTGRVPLLTASIPVGLEPVAVALAPNGHLWVVNHLSDSVSVVDVSVAPARVVNTLLVGDEPRDIVFAGPGNRWALITAAHRGQNVPFDAQQSTPGVGRADVWVFDAAAPGTKLGGNPVKIINMFGDTLRGLARNADGSRVYAAVLHSGNRTTTVTGLNVVKSGPRATPDGQAAPPTGLIVQKNANGDWVDSGDPLSGAASKAYNDNVRLNLPDHDLFTIDATGPEPTEINKTTGVGTTLFNVAVNPVNGKVYVSNQEARNVVRFVGSGRRGTTLNGHFVESRITVVDANGGLAQPRHLNKHINSYSQPLGTANERWKAVATPLEMAITPDGSTLYLAAMGSHKLVRYATAQLESGHFTPAPTDQIIVSGGLPTGVVLDTARNRAFVTTRQDNGVSVINTATFEEAAHVTMPTPEPADVVQGRRFLYDATYSSSRGDSSCAGCHIFGDMDRLNWDLGDPDGQSIANTNPYNRFIPQLLRATKTFHPMKGPMSTQSLRGMAGNGAMHWRGDKLGASPGATQDERHFKDFNVAFTNLLGRATTLPDADMTALARFALKLTYPPNPNTALDNSYSAAQQAGRNFYFNTNADTFTTCNGCHVLDAASGMYGTEGTMSFEGFFKDNFKIPHLRNAYQKVGMFAKSAPGTPHFGDQLQGFGYTASGESGSISGFLNAVVFANVKPQDRVNLEQFLLAFPSNLDPVVGQQVTVSASATTQADIMGRLNLLVARAQVMSPRPECELVAKGVLGGAVRGWVMSAATGGNFVPDRLAEPAVGLAELLAQARTAGTPLTFTCAPPGNGTRMGIDRNADGTPDGG